MLLDPGSIDAETAYLVLAEIERRAREMPSFVDPNFPKQAELVSCRDRWLAVKGTRRMAKTDSISRRLLKTGFERQRVPLLYISLTRDQARRIFWDGCLKPMLDDMGLTPRMKLNEQRMEARFPNGSILYVLGMDADEHQMNKMLGGKYAGVAIDEAGSFRVDLKRMIEEKLRPALVDFKGWLLIGGTPEDFTAGLFYEITRDDGAKPRLPGWKVFEWTAYDNPYVAKNWAEEIEELKRDNPEIVRTPGFQRMYLGRWVIDNSKLVYKPKQSNFVKTLPADGEYFYALGIDLGYEDHTTFAVLALEDGKRRAYVIHQFEKQHMIIHDVAAKIRELQKRFFFLTMIIDGANKQGVEELKQYFEIPLESADKAGKPEAIELLNSAMTMNEFFVVGDDTPLELEWRELIWDERKKPKKIEESRCKNHMSDAVLYIWRRLMMMYYIEEPKIEKTKEEKTEDELDEWEERKSRSLRRGSGHFEDDDEPEYEDDNWDDAMYA